jgi:hypothetical protein
VYHPLEWTGVSCSALIITHPVQIQRAAHRLDKWAVDDTAGADVARPTHEEEHTRSLLSNRTLKKRHTNTESNTGATRGALIWGLWPRIALQTWDERDRVQRRAKLQKEYIVASHC